MNGISVGAAFGGHMPLGAGVNSLPAAAVLVYFVTVVIVITSSV